MSSDSIEAKDSTSTPIHPKSSPSPPTLPELSNQSDSDQHHQSFGFDLLQLDQQNQSLLHFLSSGSGSGSGSQSSIEPTSTLQRGLNSTSLSDDLIPAKDSCYFNLNLRDMTVRLLHTITSESIYHFIISLHLESFQIYSDLIKQIDTQSQREMIQDEIRSHLRRSTERNRTSLCQNARLESQLLVAQHVHLFSHSSLPSPNS